MIPRAYNEQSHLNSYSAYVPFYRGPPLALLTPERKKLAAPFVLNDRLTERLDESST